MSDSLAERLVGDRLHLTAQPLEVGGRTTIPRLTWRRG
jgi:hypothetical protein